MSRKPTEPFAFHFKPLTKGQEEAVQKYETCDILFLLGPAGTGKSHLAVSLALMDLQARKRKKLFMTRPLVEAGEKLGFLPGDVNEKIDPYLVPLHTILDKVSYKLPKDVVECCPLAFLRGRTFEDTVAILDESQNVSYSQMKLFLTRLGKGSKIIITGDPEQTDIRSTVENYDTDLEAIVDTVEGIKGVEVVELHEDQNLRHPLVIKLLKRL